MNALNKNKKYLEITLAILVSPSKKIYVQCQQQRSLGIGINAVVLNPHYVKYVRICFSMTRIFPYKDRIVDIIDY